VYEAKKAEGLEAKNGIVVIAINPSIAKELLAIPARLIPLFCRLIKNGRSKRAGNHLNIVPIPIAKKARE
jgi:hypothetical protein